MLKKLLTTFIVLAATATAWADGWSVTKDWSYGNEGSVDGQNTYAFSVVKWIKSDDNTGLVATLAEAITAANSADSYMIRIIGDITNQDEALSNINKEKVDLSLVTGMTNFGVFAMNTAVKYVILPDNTLKADVDALGKTVDAAASKQTRRWEYEYKGVKYAYLGEVSNGSPVHGDSESAIIKLPVQVGEPTFKVKESEESYEGDIIIADNKFYGVSAENLEPLNTAPIGYIYNVDGVPFLYKGNVYMQNDQYVYYSDEEANRKELTMHENVYTYTVTEGETVTKHIYDDQTTVVDGKIYGYVGGTKYELSRENEWYYSSNGTETLYNEYIREEKGKTYGVINYTSFIPVEYKEVYMYGDDLVTAPVRKDEKENKYYAPIWGGTFLLTKDGDNYKKQDGNLYEGNVYFDSKGQAYGIEVWANVFEVFCETRPVKKDDGSLYDGKVYHDNETPISYYGITNPWTATEVELYNKYSYKNGEESIEYTGKIYADGDKLYGFVDGIEYALTQGTAYSYADGENTVIVVDESRVSIDGKFYYTGTAEPISLTESSDVCYYVDDEGNWVVFEGAKTPDNTKGYVGTEEGRTALIAVYPYTHPNDGESTYTSESPMTNVIVDYNTTITYTTKVGNSDTDIQEGKYHIIAYVSKPGSLTYTLARWTELGVNNKHSGWGYYVTNVTALTLSGDANYADIGTTGNTITEYGHVVYTDNGQSVTPERPEHDKSVQNSSPAMNGNALTYLDLTDAVFAVQTDMQFAKVSANLVTVILPTHKSMTLIPDNAFNNLQYVSELCIPYNYEVIGSCAFYNASSLTHIYTTDPNEGTIVENGPYTFTFSANLKEIEGGIGTHPTFFGDHIEDVTDIYVLAEKAPLCGANTFAASMTYGNDGFSGDLAHPIGRHNYKNHDKWFVVLHYPSELEGTDEEKKYTDVTRVYTLADETGAVDGRGHAMMWPKHIEFGRAFRTALAGKLWDETTTYDTRYQGWHEIVLTGNSLARDYDPQTENTEFVYRDWLTICVPYNLKKSQVLSLLGVDPTKNANKEAGVIYEYVCSRDANGNPIKDSEGNYTFEYKEIKQTKVPLYPDVRALTHVSRSVKNGKMTLHFTKLIEQNEIAALSEGDNNETTVTTHDVAINESHGQGFTKTEQTEDDPVVMKGGHPYLIRAYVPKAWDNKIKNLGMYIISAASSANHAAMEDGKELPYQYGACTVQAGGVEMYLPCLKHKVHAFDADSGTEINSVEKAEDKHTSFSYTDTSKDDPILYHFIGTYASTNIPQYAYYIGKTKEGVHRFSRTTKTTYTWAPYTAVIVGLSLPTYDTEHFGDKATGSAGSISNIIVRPGVKGDDLKIYVGEDEKLGSSGARLSLGGFSDSTITGIVEIETDTVVRINDNKVYSINGQYMGTSLNNLPKGIYIINGQKKVVK
ncbi:MAG: leucine-rich repeat protein [Prevotella sp.]|nr:leucine-rich repeat protein [Prevotella sp.]